MTINNLKVEPLALKGKSEEMTAQRLRLRTTLDEIRVEIEALKTVWESEASTTFQAKFAATEDDVNKILATVQEYAMDLAEIADTYIRAAEEAKAAAESLATNIG